MAVGVLSKTIKLKYESATSPSTFSELYNLVSIGDIGNDGIDTVEITDLASSSHEFIGGLGTIPGSIEFTFNFDAGWTETVGQETHTSTWDIVSLWNPQDKHKFQVVVPGATSSETVTAAFDGYAVSKLNGATYNEGLKFTLTIVPTGTIQFS